MLLTVILVPTLVLTLRAKAHPTSSHASQTCFSYPPEPEGVTVVQSKHHKDVTISYKENNICETTDGVKSITGYVHLPAGTLNDFGTQQDYPINNFFWFFESRSNASEAPVSVWMNGGPGSPSMMAVFSENGPCRINDDSATTYLNPWSWNNHVNMIYFDEPNQVGYSYDSLNNGTMILDSDQPGDSHIGPAPSEGFVNNATAYAGVFPSNNSNFTANTTEIAAQAFWHFAQVFFEEFPNYKPDDNKLSIWAESYGGKYGPAFAARIEQTTEMIENGEFNYTDAIPLRIGNLGIVNGCIDDNLFLESYPRIAYNNTYGQKFISEEAYNGMMSNITMKGGIREAVQKCAALAASKDPNTEGTDAETNAACQDAMNLENSLFEFDLPNGIWNPSVYDLSNEGWDPKPEGYFQGYLNDARVQSAIGVPVNFTAGSGAVGNAFYSTGDEPRPTSMPHIAYLLSRGARVHMMYGDRDMICNWYGGETASLHVNYMGSEGFKAAGYTDLVVNSTYVGGQTRQFGNFSFSRVYESGHEVPWYQPETSHAIFYRAMFGVDIATGQVDTLANGSYATTGPASCDHITNELPPKHEPECYVLSGETCSPDQWGMLLNGTAVVKNYIIKS